MAVGYRNREAPAPPELVDRLEQRIGQRLPDDYRVYLLQQDGGRLQDNNRAVKHIFGIGQVPDYASMWRTLETYSERVPTWLLPVAGDEYGNLFAISLRAADLGSVWFWNHEREADEDEPPSEDNVELKAPSWAAFLGGILPINVERL
jgi:cell wall assembly regulator SMI1